MRILSLVTTLLLATATLTHAAEPPAMAAMFKERFGMQRQQGIPQELARQYPKGYKAFLAAELGITDRQQGVFDAYVAAATPPARDDFRDALKKMRETKEAPGRLSLRIQRTEEYLAWLKKRQSALETLYKALDEGQQETADKLLGW